MAKLTGSAGTVDVEVGQRFEDSGIQWEVVGFTGQRIYSPSGFGGTPIVKCRALTEPSDFWKRYQEDDGTVEWCGDSIASIIIRANRLALQPQGDIPGTAKDGGQ